MDREELGERRLPLSRLAAHAPKIREVLAASCDYYSCECHRDVKLAREMGLTAPVLPVFPNAGGFDLDELGRSGASRAPRPNAAGIVLKGYQNWAGRALVGLKAFELLGGDILRKHRIVTYTCTDDVKMAAELTAQKIGVPIEVLPHLTHDVMMDWFGQARVYLGLSISDGICTSMLEVDGHGERLPDPVRHRKPSSAPTSGSPTA